MTHENVFKGLKTGRGLIGRNTQQPGKTNEEMNKQDKLFPYAHLLPCLAWKFIHSASVEKHSAFQSWPQTSEFFSTLAPGEERRGRVQGVIKWLKRFRFTRDPRSLPALLQYTVA